MCKMNDSKQSVDNTHNSNTHNRSGDEDPDHVRPHAMPGRLHRARGGLLRGVWAGRLRAGAGADELPRAVVQHRLRDPLIPLGNVM